MSRCLSLPSLLSPTLSLSLLLSHSVRPIELSFFWLEHVESCPFFFFLVLHFGGGGAGTLSSFIHPFIPFIHPFSE
ncbi:hypothetical protein EDD21DRAFT_372727 [Dissophora ornata]|nr:hypothetical protein EDD21DRAFT_372727 [Dissophora ornata]